MQEKATTKGSCQVISEPVFSQNFRLSQFLNVSLLSRPTKADFIRTKHFLLGFVYRGNKNSDDKESQDVLDGDVSKQLHASVRTANLETSLRLLSCGADPNFLHPVIII